MPDSMLLQQRIQELLPLTLAQEENVMRTVQNGVQELIVIALLMHEYYSHQWVIGKTYR